MTQNDTSFRQQLGADSPGETFALMVGGMMALSALIAALPRIFASIPTWLVAHQVLVTQPLLALPGCRGAGLDGGRLIIVLGLLAMALSPVVTIVLARAREHRRDRDDE